MIIESYEVNPFLAGIVFGIVICCIAYIIEIFTWRNKIRDQRVKTHVPAPEIVTSTDNKPVIAATKRSVIMELMVREQKDGRIRSYKSMNDHGLTYLPVGLFTYIYQNFGEECIPKTRLIALLPLSYVLKSEIKEVDIKPIGN